MSLVLVPAYGRDYKTVADVRKAWEGGKDFQIASIGPHCGMYCSIRDAKGNPSDFVGAYIRYDQLTELTFIDTWDEPRQG